MPRGLSLLGLIALNAAAADRTVILDGFTHIKQRPDFCGEADVEMALTRAGRPTTQDEVFRRSGLDPAKGRGVHADELATALRSYGYEPGQVWYRVDPQNASTALTQQWAAIHADLTAGRPSIVCMHYDDTPGTSEHFRLVTGYDATTDEVVYQEPAEEHGANRRMPRSTFFTLWMFKPAVDRWMLIRHRFVQTGPAEALAPEVAPLAADVAQRVMTLPKEMTVVWEKPFLVIGNEGPNKVASRGTHLVRWTRDLLLKDFFATAPEQLEEIWVLKDAPTYEATSRKIFGVEPTTPYGYYLSSRRAQVMNIKPGSGTLVHEMVHPFFHHAWPDVPAWINEGVASLFEHPYEDGGHLKGRVNWRLPGLLQGLRAKVLPSFHALAHSTTDEFYEDRLGVNYAMARYLCYWLQEQGLLVAFVRRAQALRVDEPTGWRALTDVLGGDPDARRSEWERFISKLNRS